MPRRKLILLAAVGVFLLSGASFALAGKKNTPALNIHDANTTIKASVPRHGFFNRKTWRILSARHASEIVVNLRVVSNDGKVLDERTTAYEIHPSKRGYRVRINQGDALRVRNRRQLLTVITQSKSIAKPTQVSNVKRAYVELSISLNPIDIYHWGQGNGAALTKWVKTVHVDHQVTFRSASIQL